MVHLDQEKGQVLPGVGSHNFDLSLSFLRWIISMYDNINSVNWFVSIRFCIKRSVCHGYPFSLILYVMFLESLP